jgi:Uma2 family endonuclease
MTNIQTLPAATPPQTQVSPSRNILLSGIKWQTFLELLADMGGDRACRIAYSDGLLELRMPLTEHEEPKVILASCIEALADMLEIEVRQLGALTLKREDLRRAVEPDTCFYVQNEARVRGKNINLPNDPPPDLVIESDYTNSSLNKFNIYAALGVPELWRYQTDTLQVYRLVAGEYELSNNSLAFPSLPIAEVPGFVEQSSTIGQRATVRLFRTRMREILAA